MRRLFLFLWTLSLALLTWVLWQRREDLKRSYGEWRAATDAARRGAAGASVAGPAAARPAPAPRPTAEPPRCAATTRSGKRCTRPAEEGSRFCWQHAD
jgi:hypothetical protein